MQKTYKKYIRDLEKLVNIDSPTEHQAGVAKIAKFFAKKYKKMGFKTVMHDLGSEVGPALEITNCEQGEADIVLIGHQDTVFPVGTAAKRPFSMDKKRAYGPGVVDMKGGLLVMLYALKAAHKTGEQLPKFTIIQTPDEETGSKFSTPLLLEKIKNARCVLSVEAGRIDGEFVHSRKGTIKLDMTFKGKSAHAGAEPQNGASAVLEMANAITKLCKFHDLKGGTYVNAGVANGGEAAGMVSANAAVSFSIKYENQAKMDLILKAVENIKKNPSVKGVSIEYETSGRPAHETSAKNLELADIMTKLGDEVDNIDVRFIQTGGGGDTCTTANAGIPSIDGCGPVGGNMHNDAEYLELDSIVPRIEILTKTLLYLAKKPL